MGVNGCHLQKVGEDVELRSPRYSDQLTGEIADVFRVPLIHAIPLSWIGGWIQLYGLSDSYVLSVAKAGFSSTVRMNTHRANPGGDSLRSGPRTPPRSARLPNKKPVSRPDPSVFS